MLLAAAKLMELEDTELTSVSDVQREMSHVPHMWKLKEN